MSAEETERSGEDERASTPPRTGARDPAWRTNLGLFLVTIAIVLVMFWGELVGLVNHLRQLS